MLDANLGVVGCAPGLTTAKARNVKTQSGGTDMARTFTSNTDGRVYNIDQATATVLARQALEAIEGGWDEPMDVNNACYILEALVELMDRRQAQIWDEDDDAVDGQLLGASQLIA